MIGLACALLVGAAGAVNRLQGLESAALDTLFQLRGTRYPSPQVVILAADDATVARFGGWPIPRHVYADVVRRLAHAGARTIAFDVAFPTDAPGLEADDAALAAACREAHNVIQAAVLNPDHPASDTSSLPRAMASHARDVGGPAPAGQAPAGPGQSGNAEAAALAARFALDDRGVPCHSASSAAFPRLPLLREAARVGHITVFPERDGALRRIPHVIRYHGSAAYPSLALAAAAHYLGVPPQEVVASATANGGEILLAGRHIPLNSDGEALVNWVGRNGTIPILTFNKLFDTPRNDGMFRDKAVMVGITAAGAYEHHATPFSPNVPVVELQANALDNILTGHPLQEVPDWVPLLLLLLFPCATGALIGGRDARISAVVTLVLAGALWLGAVLLFSFANTYVPVAAPLLGAVMTCGVSVGQRQIHEAQQLRRAEERYALAVRGANDGLWDWDLSTQEIYFSPRWKAMLGYDDSEIGSRPAEWLDRIHEEDRPHVQHELKMHLEGATPHFQSEYRILHRDGEYRWMLCRGLQVRDERRQATGPGTRMAGSQTDITSRKEAEAKLQKSAFYDSLTGLPNRALFINRLEQAIGRAKRNPHYLFAVLFLDLDRFKNVNDSLGHTQGDKLLIEVAHRMTECLRPGDTPARLGGDEFTLLLDDLAHASDATRVAERFQTELSRPFELDGTEVFSQVSTGVALSTTGYDYPEDVLRDADTAMYRAKALGTGNLQVFDEAMHARAVALLRLETDLRRAIERQNFQVYYQPIVSLETGHIAGFEALARWNHPTRGIVPPGEFIAIAEDTGIIISIDQWVLHEACRQTHAWQARFGQESPLTISVNLSSKQFSQSDLVAQIERTVRATGFNPADLKLEITEGVLMENAESAAAMLRQLKELGIQLSIDDFGTGYSSLSYLHRFPLDVLKVDRSFVIRLGPHGENAEIVRAIITLAGNLGMRVIAEGVETVEQLAQLRALGCHYGQGYLFSKPITGDAATVLLAEDPVW